MGLYGKNKRLTGKTILFKFKILVKVIFKYRLQSQQVLRIWKSIVSVFWGES
jgi:hypothetical protein